MPKVLSDRIVFDIDDWLGGLVPQANNSLSLSIGGGAAYQRNVNPFRQLGAIVPGYAPAAVTNEGNLDAVIVAGDADYSGTTPYAYLLGGSTAKINRIDLSSDTVSGGATEFPHTLNDGHSTIVGEDLVIFSITSGVSSATSVFAMASFRDATDGNIAAHDITSGLGVFYENFFSAQPEGGVTLTTDPHPMIIGDDGGLYIGNGNTLMLLDGTTGGSGVASTKLTFPKGTVIRSFARAPQHLVIYASRSNLGTSASYRGRAIAYFWNYVSSKYNFAYELNDNIVKAGFNWDGKIGCFTYGRATGEGGSTPSTKIKLFNGSGFETIHEYRNNPPGHGSVEVHQNLLVWLFGDNSQSYIASLGAPWPRRIKGGLNFWGEPQGTSLSLSTQGVCKNLGGMKLYVSSGAGMSTFSSGYGPITATGSFWYGLTTSPSFPSKTRGRLKSVKIHYNGTSIAGRTVSVTLQLDTSSSSTLTLFSGTSAISSAGNTIVEYFQDSNNIPLTEYQFHSLAPRITWDTGTGSDDAPAIKKIEIFFETIQFNQA